MINTYDPRQTNDIRFQSVWERFPGSKILFTSGSGGWSWSAAWRNDGQDLVIGSSGFLSPETAVDHCLETFKADEVKWQVDPFAKKKTVTSPELAAYLQNWDKKFKK